VDSGRVDLHPMKRLRTTLGYVVIAMVGTAAERAAMRREVSRSHAAVHSFPGDGLTYDAFDPDLQLWVAACLYRGLEMINRLVYGPPDEETADLLYHHCARFGTTLQVSDQMWPASREAFERYWADSLASIEMDGITRPYLRGVARLGFLPAPIGLVLGPAHEFLVAGFLPEQFRAQLGLSWGPHRQAAFDRLTAAAGRVTRLLPPAARQFPLNLYLWDSRCRIEAGRPIV
jgi:uncharacterized protein (DUF2236 family)